jgi:hypothetical protein
MAKSKSNYVPSGLAAYDDDIYSGFFMGGGWSWTTVWILRDFGKMTESQNKKIGHRKKLRIKEIPVGFRYIFENGIPDQRGRV